MRILAIPAALCAASMLALPAIAATTPTPQNSSNPPTSMSSSQNDTSSMSPQQTMQIQHKIASQLEQNGFTDVHVIPQAFLVRATNKQGQSVVMIIHPDSVFSVTKLGTSSASNGSATHADNSGSSN